MPGAVCIALIGSMLAVVLPTDKITLSWTHTVERTPWEEDYAIEKGALVITEARVTRGGAGMDAPSGAVWAQGWWRYVPSLDPLPEILLANSSFAGGYSICWEGRCRPLTGFIAADNIVKLVPKNCDPSTRLDVW
jgi:hypothetical protein